jgi:hypothetical protein
MIWKILAETVVVLHLGIILFFTVSAVLLALGVFRGRRNWQIFYWSVLGLAVGLRVGDWTGLLESCSITDLEYMLRRMYDPSEVWMREGSLLATVAYNTTGIEIPEFVFTVLWGVIAAVMVSSLIFRRK